MHGLQRPPRPRFRSLHAAQPELRLQRRAAGVGRDVLGEAGGAVPGAGLRLFGAAERKKPPVGWLFCWAVAAGRQRWCCVLEA